MRHRTGTESDDAELEMTPMIDVTFLLLIFFLCTLRFKTLEGKLSAHLPKDVGGAPVGTPVEPLLVGMTVTEPGLRLAPGGGPHPGRADLRHEWNRDPARGPARTLAYTLQGRPVPDLATLGERLERMRRSLEALGPEGGVRLTLDPGPDTCQGDVVPLLDACTAAGFDRITFAPAR